VPTAVPANADDEGAQWWRLQENADVRFVAWLVARNAETLSRRPHRLFDTAHCAPAERTLTSGDPMIALGLLGIPASVLGLKPVAVYNLALLTHRLVLFLAMYLLIAAWTSDPMEGHHRSPS